LNSLVRFYPDASITSLCIKSDPATTCYVCRGNRKGLRQRYVIFLRVYWMLWFDQSTVRYIWLVIVILWSHLLFSFVRN